MNCTLQETIPTTPPRKAQGHEKPSVLDKNAAWHLPIRQTTKTDSDVCKSLALSLALHSGIPSRQPSGHRLQTATEFDSNPFAKPTHQRRPFRKTRHNNPLSCQSIRIEWRQGVTILGQPRSQLLGSLPFASPDRSVNVQFGTSPLNFWPTAPLTHAIENFVTA